MSNRMRSIVYCWFDSEYTDLDYDKTELLQVAIVVTDEALRPIGCRPDGIPSKHLTKDGFVACLQPPPESRISQHVLDNYQSLLQRCVREGIELDAVDRYLALYMEQFPEAKSSKVRARPVLAGNSIHADLYLVRKFLPRFAGCINYRLLDVSSQKLEWKHYFKGEKFRKKSNPALIQKYYSGRDRVEGDKHDAFYDVQASIAELAFYRSRLKIRSNATK